MRGFDRLSLSSSSLPIVSPKKHLFKSHSGRTLAGFSNGPDSVSFIQQIILSAVTVYSGGVPPRI